MFAVLTAARMLATSSTSGTGVGGDVAVLVPLYLIIIAAFAYAWLRIANKAGYSGWWVLCALLPIIGIVVFFVFAFAPWPALENPYQLSWQPVPSGDHARHVVELIEKAYESSRTGQALDLTTTF